MTSVNISGTRGTENPITSNFNLDYEKSRAYNMLYKKVNKRKLRMLNSKSAQNFTIELNEAYTKTHISQADKVIEYTNAKI